MDGGRLLLLLLMGGGRGPVLDTITYGHDPLRRMDGGRELWMFDDRGFGVWRWEFVLVLGLFVVWRWELGMGFGSSCLIFGKGNGLCWCWSSDGLATRLDY